MAGHFEGLTDAQWAKLEALVPPLPSGKKGRPPVPRRDTLNTILFILITGSRWCDTPKHQPGFATKSSAHRWLKRWEEDGTWVKILNALLAMAEIAGLINWASASVDGSFSPWEGWWQRDSLWIQRQRSAHALSSRLQRDAASGYPYPR